MTQQTVNGEAKEAVDTLDYILQVGLEMWEMLPLEIKAFILSIFTISILMQWIKKALLANHLKKERVKRLWLSSLPLGSIIAGIGWYVGDGAVHVGYWLVIGLTAGATAMGVHYVTMKAVVPLFRALWDRFMLAVRGS